MKRQNNFIGNDFNLSESTEIKNDQPILRSVSTQPGTIFANYSQDNDSNSDSEMNMCSNSLSYISHSPLFVPYQPKEIVSNRATFAQTASHPYRLTQSAERSIRIQRINLSEPRQSTQRSNNSRSTLNQNEKEKQDEYLNNDERQLNNHFNKNCHKCHANHFNSANRRQKTNELNIYDENRNQREFGIVDNRQQEQQVIKFNFDKQKRNSNNDDEQSIIRNNRRKLIYRTSFITERKNINNSIHNENNNDCTQKRTSYCNYLSTITPNTTLYRNNSEQSKSKSNKRSDYINKIELVLNNQNLNFTPNTKKTSLNFKSEDLNSTSVSTESSKRTQSNRFPQYRTEYNSDKHQFVIKRLVSTSKSTNQADLNSGETNSAEFDQQQEKIRSSTSLFVFANNNSTQPLHKKTEVFKESPTGSSHFNLVQRRQRNLTTSLAIDNKTGTLIKIDQQREHSAQRSHFDSYLNSLEEIDNFLKKSSISDLRTKQSAHSSKREANNSAFKEYSRNKEGSSRHRRNLTQPITLDCLQNERDATQLLNLSQHSTSKSFSSIQNLNETNYASNLNTMIQRESQHQPTKDNQSRFYKSSINSPLNKKFVSLSEILSNEKQVSIGFESPNNAFLSALTSPTATTGRVASSSPFSNSASSNGNNSSSSSNNFMKDLLTVQELFKELELDCDEQIKQLDEIERKRNENKKVQMNIIQQIKSDYSRLLFCPTENLTKRRLTKLKSLKENDRFRFHNSHLRTVSNLVLKRKIVQKEFFICKYALVCNSFEFYSNKRIIKRPSEYVSVNFVLKKRKPSGNVCHLLTSADLKALILVDENHIHNLFFLVKNSSRIEFARISSQPKNNKPQRAKNKKNMPPLCSSNAISSNKGKSLLDKYFDRYCSADRNVTNREEGLRRKEGDEEKQNSFINKKSIETIHKLNEYLKPNSAFKQIDNQKASSHFIDASSSISNQELLNMIEVSKWLIQAGYAQHVHSFLKTKSQQKLSEKSETLNRNSHDELNTYFESVKKTEQHLQEDDLKAIYRRLEILHNSSHNLNFDYNHLKENYLKIEEEDTEQEVEEDDNENIENELNCPLSELKFIDQEDIIDLSANELKTKKKNSHKLKPLYLDEKQTEEMIELNEINRKLSSSSSASSSSSSSSTKLSPMLEHINKLKLNATKNSSTFLLEEMKSNEEKTLRQSRLVDVSSSPASIITSRKSNALQANKFVCIQFPLNSNISNHQTSSNVVNKMNLSISSNSSSSSSTSSCGNGDPCSLTTTTITQKQLQENNQSAENRLASSSTNLTRFHSFRLNDKLATNLMMGSYVNNNYNLKQIENRNEKAVNSSANKLNNKENTNYVLDLIKPAHAKTSTSVNSSTSKSSLCSKSQCNLNSNNFVSSSLVNNHIILNNDYNNNNKNKLNLNSFKQVKNKENQVEQQKRSMSSSSPSRNSLLTIEPAKLQVQHVQAQHLSEQIVNKSNDEKDQSTLNKFIKSTNKSKSRTATVVTSLRKSIRRKEKSKKATSQVGEDERLTVDTVETNSNAQQHSMGDSEYFLPKIEFVHEHYDNEPSSESSQSDEYESEMNNLSIANQNNENKTNLSGDSMLNVPSDDEQHLIEQLSTPKDTNNANSSSELIIKREQDLAQQVSTQTVSKRERKDSGVGGSLTRQNRRKEKWNSFIKSHRPSFKSSKLQINSLSVKQYSKLKKFALVRITAQMEKHSAHNQSNGTGVKSGWNRIRHVPHKLIKKHYNNSNSQQNQERKSIDLSLYKSKLVFGVPFKLNTQRHGQPLPQSIIQIMRYLRRHSLNSVGIFRKSGSKARMQLIREGIEKTNIFLATDIDKLFAPTQSNTNATFDLNSIGSGLSSHSTSKSDLVDDLLNTSAQNSNQPEPSTDIVCIDLADILKQYFRELPECLFTNKYSQTLIDIFTYLPESERLEAVQYCMLLIDDEHRDAIQCFMLFLNDIAQNHQVHKMDSRNIAICLAPTLLNMNNIKEMPIHQSPSSSSTASSTTPNTPTTINSLKDSTLLMSRQCNASLDCLTFMIENSKRIFQIPNEAYTKCQFTKMDYSIPLTLNELLGNYTQPMLNLYLTDRIDEMLKELKDKPKNWTRFSRATDSFGIDVHYKSLSDDDEELRLWKLTSDIENASAMQILQKLLKCRSQWDDDLQEFRIVESLADQNDIIQYVTNLMAPQASRDFCELRCWKEAHVNQKQSYLIYSQSLEHEKAPLLGDIRAHTLRSFYMIEPINEKKFRLYQLYRADYKGYSPEWYNKMQGHLLRRQMVNLKRCLETK